MKKLCFRFHSTVGSHLIWCELTQMCLIFRHKTKNCSCRALWYTGLMRLSAGGWVLIVMWVLHGNPPTGFWGKSSFVWLGTKALKPRFFQDLWRENIVVASLFSLTCWVAILLQTTPLVLVIMYSTNYHAIICMDGCHQEHIMLELQSYLKKANLKKGSMHLFCTKMT